MLTAIAQRPIQRGETAPRFHREWIAAQQNKLTQFEEQFAQWLKGLAVFEETANRCLYENGKFNPLDLRFHRSSLACVIAEGEGLAIDGFMLVELEQMDQSFYEAHVQIIDQHLAKFTARMHEWHGTLESQSDIPDSVKEAFGESDRGEIIPFPEK